MSTMTAQNINFCALRTHPVLPFESFFKMRPPTEPPNPDITKTPNTEELLERIRQTELDYKIPNPLDLRHQRVSRHLSGGGLLREKKSSYDLSTNPFKNKLRVLLAKEEEYCTRNPFQNSSPKKEIPSPTIFLTSPKTATPTDSVPWLLGNQSEQDLLCLQKSMKGLSMSGWYYENVSWKDSIALLQSSEPGTFFVRDSADTNFLFSLSVQTVRGPTSIRLHYINGRFRLDAEPELVQNIPSFESVIELVEHYVAYSKRRKNKLKKINKNDKEQVWIDLNGQVYSNILLSKPLIKDNSRINLKHLCRLKVNNCLRSNVKDLLSKNLMPNVYAVISNQIDQLSISQYLKDYLYEYPFTQ